MSIGGTLSPTRTIAAARGPSASRRCGGRDRGREGDDAPGMPIPTAKHRVALIDQMASEWSAVGRSPAAVRSLREIAGRDVALSVLVLGPEDGSGGPPPW